MTTAPDPLLDSRSLCLIPADWWQRLLSADPQYPPEEVRRLSFHGKADWAHGESWFDDPALSDILFEIDILSDTTAWERSPEWKGTIGGLRYNDEVIPLLYGIFSVSDAVFEDLWERVKFGGLLPRAVWLTVLGLQPGIRDHWDVKKHPKLKVLSVEFSFSKDQSSAMRPNHANPTDAKKRRG